MKNRKFPKKGKKEGLGGMLISNLNESEGCRNRYNAAFLFFSNFKRERNMALPSKHLSGILRIRVEFRVRWSRCRIRS